MQQFRMTIVQRLEKAFQKIPNEINDYVIWWEVKLASARTSSCSEVDFQKLLKSYWHPQSFSRLQPSYQWRQYPSTMRYSRQIHPEKQVRIKALLHCFNVLINIYLDWAAFRNHCWWCMSREELFFPVVIFPNIAIFCQYRGQLPCCNTETFVKIIWTYLFSPFYLNLFLVAGEKNALMGILTWSSFSCWTFDLGSSFRRVSIVVGLGTMSCESDMSISSTVSIGFEKTGFIMREANIDLKFYQLFTPTWFEATYYVVITCNLWSLRGRILSIGKAGISLP